MGKAILNDGNGILDDGSTSTYKASTLTFDTSKSLLNSSGMVIEINDNYKVISKTLLDYSGVIIKVKESSVTGGTGESAYQTWLSLGNTGDEAAFIADLKSPATNAALALSTIEATVQSNEEVRQSNESTRSSNESTVREANEIVRVSQEATRVSNENARIAKETSRVNAEIQRESDFKAAKDACNTATLASVNATKNLADYTSVAEECKTATTNANTVATTASNLVDSLSSYKTDITNLKNNKIDTLYLDTTTSELVALANNTEKFRGVVGTGGGGSGSTINFKLTATTSIAVKTVKSDTISVGYNFTSVYSDNTSTGNGYVQYTVNNIAVETATISQGNNTWVCSNYLVSGDNTIIVKVTDSTSASRLLTYTIQILTLSVTSTFDDTQVYSGDINFKFTPVGSFEKTAVFILDGVTLVSPSTILASGREQSYPIQAQSHGHHLLEMYMTATVDGNVLTSNHLYYDIISVVAGDSTVIIASNFVTTSASQYDKLAIDYIIYDPSHVTATANLYVNDVLISTNSVDRTKHTWNYTIKTTGSLVLKIACGSVSRTFTINVTAASTNIEAYSSSMALYLTALNRSNLDTSSRSIWAYNGIIASLNNFNYTADGWLVDESGSSVLRVGGGATVDIPYKPFDVNPLTTGKTIEIEFSTRDIINYTDSVITCLDGNIGINITFQQITFTSANSTVSCKFKEEERIRLSLVIEPLSSSYNRFVYIYINGISSGVVQYPSSDIFIQTNPKNISIGSTSGTVDIYNIRIYDTVLDSYTILINYLADLDNYDSKISILKRNNVYNESSTDVDMTKVLNNLKIPCLVIVGTLPVDKKYLPCSLYYTDPVNTAKSWTCTDGKIAVQGTSSLTYPVKNYKFKFNSIITYSADSSTSSVFALDSDQMAVNCFCIKADYAESSGTHNTGIAYIINKLLVDIGIKTPPQVSNSQVRTTVYGFPICVFHKDTESSTLKFWGKYNFNNDKSTQETFGFSGNDECWEFLNNNTNNVVFKTSDYDSVDSSNNYIWLSDFEARYIGDSTLETAFASGTKPTNLKRVTDWIASTNGDSSKFKNEVSHYFVLDNLLAYYVLTELFGMTDQRAKNMFLTHYSGDVDSDGNYLWRFIFYDNDTCLGIDNTGHNIHGYNIEYHDYYNTNMPVWDDFGSSVLWNNVEAAYQTEIAAMYKLIRTKLNYNTVISVFNTRQSDRWCESIYNEDQHTKYILPYLNNNQDYLYENQGSRADHRKWWVYNRFKYMDSKYVAGDFLSDIASMRIYTPSGTLAVTPSANYTITPYNDSYIAISYEQNVRRARGTKDEPVTITAPDNMTFNDTNVVIYGASRLKSLGDLSPLYAKVINVANCTKLTSLIVGNATSGYNNSNLISLSVGSNTLLQLLDIRNCSNLTDAIDVSGCTNIQTIYASGSSISGIVLPNASALTTLQLPDTLVSLVIKNQINLKDYSSGKGLSIDGVSKIISINLYNVGFDVFALVARCLAVTNSLLTYLRLIDINGTGTAETLSKMAALRGIDENDQPMSSSSHAQITGTYNIDTLTKAQLIQFNSIFTDLNIVSSHILSTTTLNFSSSQNHDLTGSTLTYTTPSSNKGTVVYTKISDSKYTIQADDGDVINFTYTAPNHSVLTGTFTIGKDKNNISVSDATINYTATYIPIRKIQTLEYENTSVAVVSSIVFNGVTYTANSSGLIEIRTLLPITGTLTATNYDSNNTVNLTASTSDDDSQATVYYMQYAVRVIKVTDYDDNSVLTKAAYKVNGTGNWILSTNGYINYKHSGNVTLLIKAPNHKPKTATFTTLVTSSKENDVVSEYKTIRTITVVETTTPLTNSKITINSNIISLATGVYTIKGDESALVVQNTSCYDYNEDTTDHLFGAFEATSEDSTVIDVNNTITLTRIIRTIQVLDSKNTSTPVKSTITINGSSSQTQSDGTLVLTGGKALTISVAADLYNTTTFNLNEITATETTKVYLALVERTIKIMGNDTGANLNTASITLDGVTHNLTDGTYVLAGEAKTGISVSMTDYNSKSDISFDAITASVTNIIVLNRIVRTIQIVDSETSNPIEGASISINSNSTAITDSSGSITMLGGGSISSVVISKDLYNTKTTSIDDVLTADGTTIISIKKIVRTISIIDSRNSNPVVGALVKITSLNGTALETPINLPVTDSSGKTTYTGVDPMSFTITTSGYNEYSTSFSDTLTADTESTITQVQITRYIKVIDYSTSNIIANAPVYINGESTPHTTTSNGVVSIVGLYNSFTYSVKVNGYNLGSGTISTVLTKDNSDLSGTTTDTSDDCDIIQLTPIVITITVVDSSNNASVLTNTTYLYAKRASDASSTKFTVTGGVCKITNWEGDITITSVECTNYNTNTKTLSNITATTSTTISLKLITRTINFVKKGDISTAVTATSVSLNNGTSQTFSNVSTITLSGSNAVTLSSVQASSYRTLSNTSLDAITSDTTNNIELTIYSTYTITSNVDGGNIYFDGVLKGTTSKSGVTFDIDGENSYTVTFGDIASNYVDTFDYTSSSVDDSSKSSTYERNGFLPSISSVTLSSSSHYCVLTFASSSEVDSTNSVAITIPVINTNVYNRVHYNYAIPSAITITKNSTMSGNYTITTTSESITRDEDGTRSEVASADYLIATIETFITGIGASGLYSKTFSNIQNGTTNISGTLDLTDSSYYYWPYNKTLRVGFKWYYNGNTTNEKYSYIDRTDIS